MKKDYSKSAEKLVQAMGGKDNITRVFHCMTRLRFYVKDKNKIDEAEIKKLPEISGVNWHQDQFQVIAGNEVNEMYAELVKMGVPNDDADSSAKTTEKKSIGSAIIDSVTGCMTPMIPALTAAGMIKVVLTLLTTFNLVSDTSSTYQVISFIGDAAFYFMPFLIAANAAKVFNVNQSLALIIAGVFLHPNFTAMIESGDPITFFSIPVTPTTYSYSVIPVILMVWIMSYIVKLVDRITPRIVKLILHPTLVILISAPIAIIVVGPLGGIIGDGLAVAIDFLSTKLGFIIVGILWYPHRKKTTAFRWSWAIPLISIFISAADFSYLTALNQQDSMISVVSLIRRGSVIVSFICGVLIFHEKNLKAKALDLALILVGMVFIWLGSR